MRKLVSLGIIFLLLASTFLTSASIEEGKAKQVKTQAEVLDSPLEISYPSNSSHQFEITIVDAIGDVATSFIDIVEGSVSSNGTHITVAIKLRELPHQLYFNHPETPDNYLEYEWSLYIDVDGNPLTGCPCKNGTEVSISLMHFKFPGSVPKYDTILNETQKNIWIYDSTTRCSWRCVASVTAIEDFNSNSLIMVVPLQSIPWKISLERCNLYFQTAYYHDGKDYASNVGHTTFTPIPPLPEFVITKEEAGRLAGIAEGQAEYFRSVSGFLKNGVDPSKYVERLAGEWRRLGEELLPSLGETPTTILLKIFRADEVKAMGDLCKGILAPFKSLSETAFWNEFWMREELREPVSSIIAKLDKLSGLYSKESEQWSKAAMGYMDRKELLRTLEEEKSAINELINALDRNIPLILSEFKVKAYKPITIYKGEMGEGETQEHSFDLRRQPEFMKITVAQEPTPRDFWLTKPSYKLELYWYKPKLEYPFEHEWVEVWSSTGLELEVPSGIVDEIAGAVGGSGHEKFKLRAYAEDLGGDNWLTFWVDEGYKKAEIQIILKYGREETSYSPIYATQASALENLQKTLTSYLNYCKQITQRTINELEK